MRQKFSKIISKSLTFFLIVQLIAGIFLFVPSSQRVQADSSTWTQTSQTDFQQGTYDSNYIDTNISPGDLKLAETLSTHTDTTQDDFDKGHSQGNDLTTITTSTGAVSLSKTFNYNTASTPAIASNRVLHSWLDTTTHYLYVSVSGGLSVIDTKGTATASDDTLVIIYSANSTPAIVSNFVYHSWLDITTNLLYISAYGGGLSVVDTQGTATTTDDTLWKNYKTNSTPAIIDAGVMHSWLDTTNNLLYVSTVGGLSVINTQGTATTTDDTLWKNYKTNSTPAIANNIVYHSWLDTTTHYLYVGTYGGLSVIDTKNTATTSDDILAITYNTASTPAIASDSVLHSWLDTTTHYLYVSTGGGLSVIDTKNTATTSDDILAITYNTASTPAIVSNFVYHSWLDTTTHYLYVGTYGGLSVIDTKNTATTSDDTLVITYSTASTPAIAGNWVAQSWLDTTNNLLYASIYGGGLSVIKPNYNQQEAYISKPINATTSPSRVIKWTATTPSNTSVSLQTRSGDSNAFWIDDFNDADNSNVSDRWTWVAPFGDVTSSNSILTMSDPVGNDNYMWVDTGITFPAGSVIKAKIKMNTNATDYSICAFTDEWDDGYSSDTQKNEWAIVTLVPNLPFSTIGFETYWDSGWQAGDTFQIDWVSIESPNGWSSWSDVYANSYGSVITSSTSSPYLQYRATLTTTDTSVTPTLDSVTWASGYQASSTYTSPIVDLTRANLGILSWAATTPTSTSISFKVRTGNQVDFSDATAFASLTQTIVNGVTDLSTLTGVTNGHRYFQYQATLTTNSSSTTPTLSSVSLSYNCGYGQLYTNQPEVNNNNLTPATTPATTTPATVPPAANNPLAPLTQGSLVKSPDSDKVYLITNNQRFWIPNAQAFTDAGYQWNNIQIVSSVDLAAKHSANLIKTSDDPAVYALINNQRHHIPNPAIFTDYNYQWADIITVNQSELNGYTIVTLFKTTNNPDVYYLDNNQRHHIVSAQIFNQHNNWQWDDIVEVSQQELEYYQEGGAITE